MLQIINQTKIVLRFILYQTHHTQNTVVPVK